jgi:hypothetical protein
MKNLFLSAFMLAFTAVATAQTENNTQTTTPATQPATTITAPASQQPATMTTPATTATTAQTDDYAKIQQSQIAPAVLKEAVSKYKDYALVEAMIAEDGSNYKLVLTKDGKDVAAYYKKTGEFIKEETV